MIKNISLIIFLEIKISKYKIYEKNLKKNFFLKISVLILKMMLKKLEKF